MHSPEIEIQESNSLEVNLSQLDDLFEKIGWGRRGEDKWAETLSKSSHLYTLSSGGAIIAMGRILEDGVMCMFYDIGVHPDFQGKGLGKRVMQNLMDQVKDKEYVSIGLFAWEGNPTNIPFYESLGFKQTQGMELLKYMTPDG